VFTYLVATKDQLGMAKDTMAAKPLVLYESDDLIAMASEEVAIRAILPRRNRHVSTPTMRRSGYGKRKRRRHDDPGGARQGAGHAHGAADRPSLFIEFDPDAEERFTYPWAPDVDFNKRTEIDAADMTTTEVNAKIRALMEEGYGTIVLKNPRGMHSSASAS
jgi:asparagine synthetase B (glutamine-hydrolysing)